MKSIAFYTDNRVDFPEVKESILKSGLPIVSCSLKPLDFGKNITLNLERGPATMFKQIITALEASDGDYIFLCEHDVIYDPSHFEFEPEEDKFYFNTNVWRWRYGTDLVIWTDDLQQLSGLSGYKESLLKYFRSKEPDGHYEPKENTGNYMSKFPNIDIRHGKNLTVSRWSPDGFRNKKYARGWKESTINEIWKNQSQH
jgi:hypothetical protein